MSKRILIAILLALLFGGVLVWLISQDSGYILIAFNQYSLEMSLWAVLLSLLVVWFILYLFRRSYKSVTKAGTKLIHHDWFDRKGRNRLRMGNGLLQFMEGRWEPAKKNLEASASLSDMPLMNLLAAATAAYELGDKVETDRLLAQAENEASNLLAVDLVRARLLLRQKNYKIALVVLQKLHRGHPNNSLILRMLADGYQGDGDWVKIQLLLPDLKRLKVIPKTQLQALQVLVTQKMLDSHALAVVGDEREQQRSRYNDYWNELPRTLRKDTAVIKVHMRCLYSFGEDVDVEKTLRTLLGKNWDEDLVKLYGLVEGAEPATQLLMAESWLAQQPVSGALLQTLSRLCQRNQLWGKARDYLEQALSDFPSAEVCFDLAQLVGRLGDHDKSTEYFKQGSLLVEKSNTL